VDSAIAPQLNRGLNDRYRREIRDRFSERARSAKARAESLNLTERGREKWGICRLFENGLGAVLFDGCKLSPAQHEESLQVL
jgi:hypothetical protein